MIDQAYQICGLHSERVAQIMETHRYKDAVASIRSNSTMEPNRAQRILGLHNRGMKMGAIATEVGVGKTTIWKVIQASK